MGFAYDNGFGEVETYSARSNGSPVYAAGYTRDQMGRITQHHIYIARPPRLPFPGLNSDGP